MHGSASPHEIRNTFVASGPSFKQSETSSAPTGNIDIAPTALHVLGLDVPSHMDGRVVDEALQGGPVPTLSEIGSRKTVGEPWKDEQQNSFRYFASHVIFKGSKYLEAAGIEKVATGD